MIRTAKFIMAAERADDDRAVCFEKEFDGRNAVRATLYISAMGVYEAEINGARVGDFILAPGWTSYFNRLQYQTYDITDMLKDENTIDIAVATGWTYGMGYRPTAQRSVTVAVALIDIENKDGTHTKIITDETWDEVTTPVTYSSIYNGERYDARIARQKTGKKARTGTGLQQAILVPQQGEKVTEQESYPVIEVITTPKGEHVLDFGYNLVGYVEFTLDDAKAGDIVSYAHAEILDKDGNFYTDNLRSAEQRITYTARDGKQTYKPRFTFQGGRYVRLDSFPYEIKPENFRFIVVHSQMKRTGYFECSDSRVNTLFDNIIRGQRGNYLDIPTDCPQRDERLGWTGDAQVFVRTAAYNFDVDRFFNKWLTDLKLDQLGDGSVPSIIPNLFGLAAYKSAAWMDAATVCPWEIYLAYADKKLLENQFESMRRYVDFIDNYGGDRYMWNAPYKHYGDWLALDCDDMKGATAPEYIAQAYFAHSTDILVKAGHILGRDVSYYEALYSNVVNAFRTHYMKDGVPVYSTQTACVLALHFKLCEESDRGPTSELLCRLIREHGNTLTTGFVGTPYLLHALTETGHNDLAYTLLLTDKFPSWLYSVKMGATTIWEHWDGINENGDVWSPAMNSYNHYAYGAVGDWLYGVAAGINTDVNKPGYEHIRLTPHPDKRLSYLKASVDTRRGLVSSGWEIKDGTVTYKFTVPEGSTADIIIGNTKHEVSGGEYEFTVRL